MNNEQIDREQLLITLDQLDQTMEVMSSVVRRLKYSLNQYDLPKPITTTVKQLEETLEELSHCH